ncbi:ATP-dependent DNA helicase [Enterococcus sp. JM9B]|uniref:ATP-dependent DNA helicase n=1 Tax=Enterococcus sp. JM9B TaxID=1857216 RepID=UPI001374B366|nr:ATP-dependent DNA helicase [Enterococcus sp. JM9B]KAF1300095.1 ATP-dependent helicase [Enterococcus sp. JM9B]
MHRGKISVRKIVEFILRRGDIDSRRVSNHTALEGAKIHRRLQSAAGEAYQKEVTLKIESQLGEDLLIVEGRADGIFMGDFWTIDEIKTSEVAFEDLTEDQIELFFYQAMVYAYIYAKENTLLEIDVQLTYFQTTEELITRKNRHFLFSELETFYLDLIHEYHKWLLFQEDWRRVRNTSLMALKFPHETYRKGQRELAVAAYKTLKAKQKLFAEAPTGTGKTISTLFPALKAMGEDEADRIFYLTAKTITRQVAEDAMKALTDVGGQAKVITITAKDKICFLEDRNCTPENCPYAKGYYNRINEGLWDLLHHENLITREVIETYARKHMLCPFEFSLDASLWCDVIIGDYNYLFDPTVYLRRFFEENDENYFFLVDEAHNLVNRSREMYSAEISYAKAKVLWEQLGKTHQKLRRSLNKVNKEFEKIDEIGKEDGWEYHHQQAPADQLIKQLFRLQEKMKEWLAANPDDRAQEQVLSFYFDVLHFLKISEFYDDHYETTVERSRVDIRIKLFCMAPAPFLTEMLNKGKASLLFSASFSPLSYYQEVLGGEKEALRYKLPSPFEEKQQKIIITNYIQTTYQRRQESLPEIVAALNTMIQAKKGNYMVFFPSYRYLDDTAALFKELYPEVTTLIQDSKMNEGEREQFLAKFEENPQNPVLAFCVLGGIFSEGIDLKGTRLIGTAIVGVGLPQINHEQELIRDYFDEQNHRGFEYAYQLPGMNKILQAAGRVIRDETDYGVVLLLDQRFHSPRYRQLFPLHWHPAVAYRPQQLADELANFWKTIK